MTQPKISGDLVAERGEELYRLRIRSEIETPENIGKMVIIDIETGDYEVDDNGLSASHILHSKRPDAALYGIRIGYKTSAAIGGVLERTTS